MSRVWPDIVVRGVGGTMVVRTRQLVKDARAANVLVYNGVYVCSSAHPFRRPVASLWWYRSP